MSVDQSTTRTSAEIEAELEGMDFGGDVDEDLGSSQSSDAYDPDSAASIEAELAEVESRALRQGWTDREQYKGDPKKWVDAKTFVARGERFAKNLEQEVAALRHKLEDFEGTKAAFVKFHEETISRKEEELKEAIAGLRVQRSQAQREGEDEQVVQIEDRIDLLKSQQKGLKAPEVVPAVAASTSADMSNPVLLEWIDDGNQWFNDEPRLRTYALSVGDKMIAEGEPARGREFLDKVAAVLHRDFPRRFKATGDSASTLANATSGAVSSTGRQAGGGRTGAVGASGKTERDLPPEDRALMVQFIREGYTTKEKFLASYFSA